LSGSAPDAAGPAHILVVDDDRRLLELIRRYLADNGFAVTTAGGPEEARAALARFSVDLIVMDVMMPGESGLELTRSLRAEMATPILLLTARGESGDRIEGLESGADDYLAKPFEPRELVLRIGAILRRVAPPAIPSGPVRFGPFLFDPEREELRAEGVPVRLTSAEASLLAVLARQPGAVVSREALLEQSRINGNVRTVDVQVTRLRRKIEDDPRLPRFLHTIRGQGYVLRAEAP
jgi:two-component system phosphate regulon response regulator OmpR